MSIRLRSRRTPFLASSALVTTIVSAPLGAQKSYTDIRRLGTSNAISRPGPQSGEELKRVFQTNRADYERVLREASWPGNAEHLFRAVESGSFSEASYPVGHTFEWMAVRRRGVAQPSPPIRWAGADPFAAFEIRFESNDRAHRFLVPKACGNLALVDMREVEPPSTRVPEPPALRVQSPSSCTGANVSVDVSVPGGIPEGGRLQLAMLHPDGRREELRASEAGAGYRWQGKLDDAGAYSFTAFVDSPAGPGAETTERITLEPCPPTCGIQLAPPPADPSPRRGKASIGIDMCSSAARAGSLAGRSVRIHHTPADGPEALVETLSLDPECRASFLLPEYGSYRFEGTATDDRGMNAACQADYSMDEPERRLDPFFTVFGGNERRWRPGIEAEPDSLTDRSAPLVGGTIGLAYPIAGGAASLFGQGGVAINLRDSDNTSIFADFGIDRNVGRGYLGGGVGVWDVNHSDTFDGTVFVHGGFNLSERVQWNFEGRLFLSMLDEIDNNYLYSTGIRYFWKR